MSQPTDIEASIRNTDLKTDIERQNDNNHKSNINMDQFFDDYNYLKNDLKIALQN